MTSPGPKFWPDKYPNISIVGMFQSETILEPKVTRYLKLQQLPLLDIPCLLRTMLDCLPLRSRSHGQDLIDGEIDGETMGTVRDFIFLGSKTTANADCSHEIKTLTPWKKSYDYPRQHIKSRDITLPTKVRLVKAMVFPVVMYGCESWSIKLSAKELMLLNCGVGEDS